MTWNIQLLGPPHKVTIDSTFLVDVPLAKSWLQPSQLDTKSSEAQRVVQGLEHTSAQWWPQSNNLLHLDMHLAAISSFVERHSLPLVNPTPKASKHLDLLQLEKHGRNQSNPTQNKQKCRHELVNSDWYVQPFWAALQKFPINPLPPQKKKNPKYFKNPGHESWPSSDVQDKPGTQSPWFLYTRWARRTPQNLARNNMRNFVISMTGWWLGPLKNMSSSVGMMKFPNMENNNVPNHQPDEHFFEWFYNELYLI